MKPASMNHLEVGSIYHKQFSKSRSRRLKDCVHRGLGQRLNKQENHSFRESGMDGFSHLYYICIACHYYFGFFAPQMFSIPAT